MKKLLTDVLYELNEKGYAISTLYPFYFPFYKKFGYEQVSTSKEISVKMSALQKLRSLSRGSGRWKAVGTEQWAEFNSLYEEYNKGRYGSFTRDQQWWKIESYAIKRAMIVVVLFGKISRDGSGLHHLLV